MKKRFVTHDTFVIEQTYDASPAQAFAAWADPAAKARWFAKPDEFDFRVGGRETNQGGPNGGPVYTFDALYQDIVPDQRIVYSYTMDLNENRISASVVTVEFKPTDSGTQLTFTEQGAFLDGHDSAAHREHGTKIILDKLGEQLRNEPANNKEESNMSSEVSANNNSAEAISGREIVNTRIFNASRELVFKAFSDPDHLVHWWGPKDFTNTFHEFDMRPNGTWRYVMHGPNGVDYENKRVFVEVVQPERIVLRNLDPTHAFFLTMTFTEQEGKTELTWRMLFDSAIECEKVRKFLVEANEQNFDRLEAQLAEMVSYR